MAQAILHDMNSLNGTFVNDQRVVNRSIALSELDRVRFGFDKAQV